MELGDWRKPRGNIKPVRENYTDTCQIEAVSLNKWRIRISLGGKKKHPHMYAQMIFDKGAKMNQWNKDDVLHKQFWKDWAVTCKTMNALSSYCI